MLALHAPTSAKPLAATGSADVAVIRASVCGGGVGCGTDVVHSGRASPWSCTVGMRQTLKPRGRVHRRAMGQGTESFDVGGLLRRARRIADMSQRELAKASGVPAATIARLESRPIRPNIGTLEKLFAATGHRLVVRDEAGTELRGYDGGDLRDRAFRRYAAHLDVRPVGPKGEGWWGYYLPYRVHADRPGPRTPLIATVGSATICDVVRARRTTPTKVHPTTSRTGPETRPPTGPNCAEASRESCGRTSWLGRSCAV
jgi:transcriptional regulator with XRE-family HTH domain